MLTLEAISGFSSSIKPDFFNQKGNYMADENLSLTELSLKRIAWNVKEITEKMERLASALEKFVGATPQAPKQRYNDGNHPF